MKGFAALKDGKPTKDVRAGFIMVKTTSESQLQQLLEESVEDNTCVLDGVFKVGGSPYQDATVVCVVDLTRTLQFALGTVGTYAEREHGHRHV